MLLNITSVTGNVNLGGITQPIIGQRKIEHDLRIKEGEVALLGGLVTRQDDKTVTGIPGLSSIPLLGNLFKGQSVDHNRDDIVIAVIPLSSANPSSRKKICAPLRWGRNRSRSTMRLSRHPMRSPLPRAVWEWWARRMPTDLRLRRRRRACPGLRDRRPRPYRGERKGCRRVYQCQACLRCPGLRGRRR